MGPWAWVVDALVNARPPPPIPSLTHYGLIEPMERTDDNLFLYEQSRRNEERLLTWHERRRMVRAGELDMRRAALQRRRGLKFPVRTDSTGLLALRQIGEPRP